MKRSEEDVGRRTMDIDFKRKTKLRWFGHVKCRDENSILRSVMELEAEGRRPVGRLKKTWNKVYSRR